MSRTCGDSPSSEGTPSGSARRSGRQIPRTGMSGRPVSGSAPLPRRGGTVTTPEGHLWSGAAVSSARVPTAAGDSPFAPRASAPRSQRHSFAEAHLVGSSTGGRMTSCRRRASPKGGICSTTAVAEENGLSISRATARVNPLINFARRFTMRGQEDAGDVLLTEALGAPGPKGSRACRAPSSGKPISSGRW